MRKILIISLFAIVLFLGFYINRLVLTLKAITFDFTSVFDIVKNSKINFIDILTNPTDGGFKATGTVRIILSNILSNIKINTMKVDIYYKDSTGNKIYMGYLSKPTVTELKAAVPSEQVFNMYVKLDTVIITLLKDVKNISKEDFTYVAKLNVYGFNVASEGKF